MKMKNLSIALMLAAGLVVGCDDSKSAIDGAADSAAGAVEGAAEGVGDAAGDLKDSAGGAMDAAKDKGADAMNAAKDKGAEALEGVKKTAGDALGGLSLDSLKDGMSLEGGQLDGIIEKVKGLIGEGKIDQAKSWITKLEGLNLPEGYADKIASLKGMLDG